MAPKPFSAADPDGPGYDAMIAEEKRLQDRRDARQYDKISDTASTGSKTTSIAQAVFGAGDYAAKRTGKQVGKSALKSGSRILPIAGYALDTLDAWAGYEADLKRGFTKEQAAARNGRRVAPGIAGALAGEAVGGPIGALVGGLTAPFFVDHVVPAVKEQMKYNFMTFSDPRRWPGRHLP